MSKRRSKRRSAISSNNISNLNELLQRQGFIKLIGGNDGQISYNDAGSLDTVPALTWDDTNLKITDDTKLSFGTNSDASIKYDESGDDFLIISGSARGIALSGSNIHIENKLGVGVAPSNTTHAITLPDSADTTGRIKANAYMTYSSQRFKKNVEVIEKAIETIQNLRGVTFTWKKNNQKDYGFIAEEVGRELPIIVEWDRNNSENSPQAMSMDYTRIIPILLEGIKSQQNQIDNLIDEIKCLKQGTEPT